MDQQQSKDTGIADLARAVTLAFAEIDNVVKNADNPFFNSSYADLSAVLNTVRPVYAKHGLAVIQAPGPIADGNISLTTVITHASGQNLMFTGSVPIAPTYDKKSGNSYITAQGAGSALTYLRRYALAALAGIAQVDDDGQAASEPPPKKGENKADGPTYAQTVADLTTAIGAAETMEELTKHEAAVKELNDQKVANAYIAKRREIKKGRK